MFNKKEIKGRKKQLSIIWVCEINNTIADSGSQ